jgi:putative peptidoglycan lipid II flippase
MRLIRQLLQWSGRPVETLGGAAFIIAFAGVVSRVLGFVRDRLLASSFGAGDVLDAYYAAFRLPDFIYGLLVLGALSAAFIPVFTGLWARGEQAAAWRLTQSALQWLVLILGGAALVGIIFAQPLASWIAPGFGVEKQSLVASLSRVMLISPIFLAISAVVGGVLVSFKQFLAYSFAPVFYNLGIIFGITILYPAFGTVGLAVGVVIGSLLYAGVQLPAFWRGGYHPSFISFRSSLSDPALRQVVRLMVPRSIAMAVNHFSLVIVTVFSSQLISGSLAAFTLANNIQSVPLGLFGIAFSMASFPVLTTLAAKCQETEFFTVLTKTTHRILYFVLPLSFFLIIFRAETVRIVLGAGAFNWEDTILTFTVLGWLSISLFAQSLIPLFARAFFALQDTKTPLFAALLSEIIHLALIPVLLSRFAIAGIAIAFSIGTIINIVLLYIALRQRVLAWHDWTIIAGALRIVSISLVAAAVAQFSKGIFALTIGRLDTFVEVATKLSVGVLIGMVVYLALSAYFALPEYLQLKRFIWQRFLRRPETMALAEDHPERGDW